MQLLVFPGNVVPKTQLLHFRNNPPGKQNKTHREGERLHSELEGKEVIRVAAEQQSG